MIYKCNKTFDECKIILLNKNYTLVKESRYSIECAVKNNYIHIVVCTLCFNYLFLDIKHLQYLLS